MKFVPAKVSFRQMLRRSKQASLDLHSRLQNIIYLLDIYDCQQSVDNSRIHIRFSKSVPQEERREIQFIVSMHKNSYARLLREMQI
jgi:hypothetical protein